MNSPSSAASSRSPTLDDSTLLISVFRPRGLRFCVGEEDDFAMRGVERISLKRSKLASSVAPILQVTVNLT
jgi:hypothetical protein